MAVVSIDYGVWATVGEAARIVGVSTSTMSRAVMSGRLSCVYRNRQCFVRRADLPGFVAPPPAKSGRPRTKKPVDPVAPTAKRKRKPKPEQ